MGQILGTSEKRRPVPPNINVPTFLKYWPEPPQRQDNHLLLSILGNSSDHQAEQTEVQPEQVTQQEYSANGHPGLPGIVEEDDLEDEDLKKPISGHLKLVIMPVSTLGIILVIVLLMRVKPHLTSGIMKYQEFYQTFSKSVCQVCKLVAPNPPKLLNGNFVEELNKSELVFEQVALNKVD